MIPQYLTPVGEPCLLHDTYPEPDEPCWQCEHHAEKQKKEAEQRTEEES